MTHTTNVYITGNLTELEVEVKFNYSYDPGRYSGPWEDCYPSEEEFELLEVFITDSKLDFDDLNNRLYKKTGVDLNVLIEREISNNLDRYIGEY